MLNKNEKEIIITESFKLLYKKAKLHNIELTDEILEEFTRELKKIIISINSYDEVKIIGNLIGFLIYKYASSSENQESELNQKIKV